MIALLDPEQMLRAERAEVRSAIDAARQAQISWARQPTRERARLIGTLRPLLAEKVNEIARAAAAVSGRPLDEKIVSEVFPLLEACRFLEKNAASILRSKRFGAAGRPRWLPGSTFEVQRKAFGVILIVAPRNYPLFIPAVQMLHALAAGNAVVVKPAEGASAPLTRFLADVLQRSAIPHELVQLLPESVEAAREAVRCGVDKACFTGSSGNGREFLARLAQQNTPSVMELSGADSVYVRADADVDLAARAIAFGLRLNAGDTCMAPHMILAHVAVADRLQEALRREGLAEQETFVMQNDAQALQFAAGDKHGLGAAIFSRDETAARAFAQQLTTGFVTINDMIVPTADPRMPFGGVRGSGFGVTRGAEGLLEMTHPQAIAVRRTRFRPHLDAPQPEDAQLFASSAMFLHGRGLPARWHALREMTRLARARMKRTRKQQ
ncbi:MAG: aldehyde dehydrogenase family protein [Chthoniobacterales bacterium]